MIASSNSMPQGMQADFFKNFHLCECIKNILKHGVSLEESKKNLF
jgi:hypothetical protein